MFSNSRTSTLERDSSRQTSAAIFASDLLGDASQAQAADGAIKPVEIMNGGGQQADRQAGQGSRGAGQAGAGGQQQGHMAIPRRRPRSWTTVQSTRRLCKPAAGLLAVRRHRRQPIGTLSATPARCLTRANNGIDSVNNLGKSAVPRLAAALRGSRETAVSSASAAVLST